MDRRTKKAVLKLLIALTIIILAVLNLIRTNEILNAQIIMERTKIPDVTFSAGKPLAPTPEEDNLPKVNSAATKVVKTATVETKRMVPSRSGEMLAKRLTFKDGTKFTPTNEDRKYLASVINAEALGESFEGKLGVGTVVINRLLSGRYGKTVESVIFAGNGTQFPSIYSDYFIQEPTEDAKRAAEEVLAGKLIFGKDVYFFYNPKTATSDWIKSRPVVTTIGNHAFCK